MLAFSYTLVVLLLITRVLLTLLILLHRADRSALAGGGGDAAAAVRIQRRGRPTATLRVLGQCDAGTAMRLREEERTVTDRGIALLRVADAVGPDRQHVRPRKCMLRE